MDSRDAAVYATVLLNIADVAITLPNWEYESNPLLLALGPESVIPLKILALTVMLAVWFGTDIRENPLLRQLPFVWFGLYAFVIATNVIVLL